MKLVPYELKNVRRTYKKTEMLSILEEFIESGQPCVKIEGWRHKNAKSCMASFYNAIKRFHMDQVRVITSKGEVYLIRTDI